MTLSPGTHLGPYEIISPLGAGGMGEVYRAKDSRLDREVAIKVLTTGFAVDGERLKRFELEAKATSALNHPNILSIFDIGTHENAPYLVAELLEGETLREKLKGGPLPPRKTVEWAVQMAHGLAAAHEKNIVHRDLKPENLFITKDGRLKILDFGLAKLTEAAKPPEEENNTPTRTVNTAAGSVMGTVGYMSPEQVRGETVDARSDLFAFGVILYEMISGRRAFKKNSAAETMNAILTEEPPEFASLQPPPPPGLERIIGHCLEKMPAARYQSARDLGFQLEALGAANSGSLAAAPARVSALRRVAFTLLLLAAGAGVVFLARHRPPAPAPLFHRLTYHKGRINSARFTPDGRSVIYGAQWEGEPLRMYLTQAGNPDSRAFDLADADIQSVSSTGEMLVRQYTPGHNAILGRMSLMGGTLKPLFTGVIGADWDPAGHDLALIRWVDGAFRLEYPPEKILATKNNLRAPRFSPGGDSVAYWDAECRVCPVAVAVVKTSGGAPRMLSSGWANVAGTPSWRPDGREVWFTASRQGETGALHAVNLQGEQRLVLRVPGSLELMDISPDGVALIAHQAVDTVVTASRPGQPQKELSWLDQTLPKQLSADGATLLFEESGEGGGPAKAIYVRPTDGSPATRVGEGRALSLSPDGRSVLALEDTAAGALPHFLLLPVGAGSARRIANDRFSILGGGSWLPDGRGFVFSGGTEKGDFQAYIQPLPGGAPLPLSGAEADIFADSVSPDGKWAFAANTKGQVILLPLVEGAAPPPRLEWRRGIPLRWVADSRALLVFNPGTHALEKYRVADGAMETLRQLDPEASDLHVSQDGSLVIGVRQRVTSTLYRVEGLR